MLKPTNPKDLIGSDKLPLHLWPSTASALGCIAMLNGALKYGRSNFRAVGVRASIYVDAAKRHLNAWFEGEEHDPDDGVPHLSAALACIAIIVDAQAAGELHDDRMYPGGYRSFVDALTPHVKRLKELHSGRNPVHYTIQSSDVSQAGNDVLQGRPQTPAPQPAPGKDAQSIPGRDPGSVVFRDEGGFVGGVQVRNLTPEERNLCFDFPYPTTDAMVKRPPE